MPEHTDTTAPGPGFVARFPDEATAARALAELGASGLQAERVHVVAEPTRNRGFDRRRLRWAMIGLVSGGVVGAILGGIVAAVGPWGAAMGAAMVGTLGLLGGLAIGESKGTEEVMAAAESSHAPGAVMLRVHPPTGKTEEVRRDLERAGATSVEEGSHTPWTHIEAA